MLGMEEEEEPDVESIGDAEGEEKYWGASRTSRAE